MWTSIKQNNLSPFLKQAKILLLILSGVLLVANLYVLSATRHHALSYNEQQNQATWFLFQLTKEFSELNSITQFATENDVLNDKTALKYELTWSRFDLLLSNQESDTFISLPGAEDYFSNLFQRFQQLEPKVTSIKTQQDADALSRELNQLYMSMIQYVNTNFRVKSPLYQEQMQQARKLNYVQIALLILLISCSVLTIFILHKESKYHKQQSLTDSLTGICNRLALFQDLAQRLNDQQPFTLYLLDLNRFKQINDRFGHQVGDQVLKVFAKRLRQINPACYRIGGDEFAMLIDNETFSDYNHIIDSVKRVVQSTILTIGDVEVKTDTSIGFATYPADSDEIHELMLIADSNMYREKHALRKVSGQS